MKRNSKVLEMTISALLCAIGIVIPIFSPLKIVLEPASFTLASHVAVFIAMFISPASAVIVSIGTTLGFFLGAFPLVVVLRAGAHLVFALTGALILKRKPQLLNSTMPAFGFALSMGLLHAVSEVLVVLPFYFGKSMTEAYYAKGFAVSVVLLVGVGTLLHSMVDFFISLLVWKPLRKFVKTTRS